MKIIPVVAAFVLMACGSGQDGAIEDSPSAQVGEAQQALVGVPCNSTSTSDCLGHNTYDTVGSGYYCQPNSRTSSNPYCSGTVGGQYGVCAEDSSSANCANHVVGVVCLVNGQGTHRCMNGGNIPSGGVAVNCTCVIPGGGP